MRTFITLAAAAPLALLAACGDTTPVEETEVVPMEAEVAELDMASEALPEVPANALDQLEYSGTYVRERGDGIERVRLNAEDDSWEYTTPDGTVTSGTYTRMDDNQRLAIEDFDGEPAYFSVANGSIYRLDSIETPPDQITVTAQYRRDASDPGEQFRRGGSTPQEQDRRETSDPGEVEDAGATVDSVPEPQP